MGKYFLTEDRGLAFILSRNRWKTCRTIGLFADTEVRGRLCLEQLLNRVE